MFLLALWSRTTETSSEVTGIRTTGDSVDLLPGPILPRAETGGRVRACGDVCMYVPDVCMYMSVCILTPSKSPVAVSGAGRLANVIGALSVFRKIQVKSSSFNLRLLFAGSVQVCSAELYPAL